MMACSTVDVDYIPLVSLFGVYFQIRDDLMNLSSPEVCIYRSVCVSYYPCASKYTSNKGFAEDLTEGKFSFPVVHGIHADKSNRQVISTFHTLRLRSRS